MINIGVFTCYINASVQCLLGCDELRTLFSSGQYASFINAKSSFGGTVAHAFAKVVQDLLGSSSAEPYHGIAFLVSACSGFAVIEFVVLCSILLDFHFQDVIQQSWSHFVHLRQMDALEFIQFILEALHEDLLVCSYYFIFFSFILS